VKPKQRGNIAPADGPDPFPKAGLTKQYEPFIRDYAGKICRNWPGSVYEQVLNDLVRLSVEAEPHHKPEKGKFGTLLFWRLKRITRLLRNNRQQIKIPGPSKEEREREKAEKARQKAEEAGEPIQPIIYRGGNGTRITIDRQWTANGSYDCRQRVIIGAQLNSTDESEAREAIERMSAALGRLLDDRPLTEIRAAIHDTIGEHVDVQFPKPRKPPNFHKWPAMVLVSFDQVVGEDDDGGKLYLKDVVAGSDPRSIPNADSDVDKLRRAIEAELPFLTPNERKVLEWKLDRSGGRLSHWAARNGTDKGYASRMNSKIEKRLAQRMKKNFYNGSSRVNFRNSARHI
jgi:hypothetical protein